MTANTRCVLVRNDHRIWKCEYQAEEFAAWLLIPEDESENVSPLNSVEISEHYRVDQRLAVVRVKQ